MTTQKATPATPAAPEVPAAGRKAWVPKTSVAIVLEQIDKQQKKVEGMRAELAREERELGKLQQAKKVLEA